MAIFYLESAGATGVSIGSTGKQQIEHVEHRYPRWLVNNKSVQRYLIFQAWLMHLLGSMTTQERAGLDPCNALGEQ